MTKYQLTRPGGPWDYPTLGFQAVDDAILDGALSTPPITTPPDAFWSVYTGPNSETGVTRYSSPVVNPPTEPADGFLLAYSDTDNQYVPRDPDEVAALPGFTSAIQSAAQTATGTVLDAELDSRSAALAANPTSELGTALSAPDGPVQTVADERVNALTPGLIESEVAPVRTVAERTPLQVAPAPGRKIAFAGDSHAAGSGVSESNRRFAVVAGIMAGTRYLARNPTQAGVAGNTSAQLLARFDADVLADPDVSHVHVQIGTNDAGTGVTPAVFAANVIEMHRRTRLSGRSMSIGLVPPRTEASGTASSRRLESAYNAWLRTWAGPAGVVLIDTRSPLTDPATGYLLASCSADGVHFNNEGHLRLGRAIADALRARMPLIPDPRVISPDVNYQSNGVMAGGGTTTVPTGYYKHPASATGTAPEIGTVADTSGTLTQGVWLEARVTATEATFFRVLGPAVAETTAWADNDALALECKVQIEDTGGYRAAANAGTASVLVQAAQGTTRLGGQEAVNWTADEKVGPVRLPFNGPTSGTSVNLLVAVTVPAGVGVKVRVGEVVIRNLTREQAIAIPA